ncbi:MULTISPECIES: hypothetical protein [Arthrobacter]|uniref:Uncharacterized protein n=1 Tax=Arthrobacter terricola TaxID=2547396 RepID=A0A4R5K576_9MICC|nr:MULTISPECIES: hypothetical protein [Arthrobacter]MBT8163784.1 hypothetical protein [Arthrobacter sp. GN70]TDF86744.1 hypothetical protein E1809_25565 [Arthrobacter terricola]
MGEPPPVAGAGVAGRAMGRAAATLREPERLQRKYNRDRESLAIVAGVLRPEWRTRQEMQDRDARDNLLDYVAQEFHAPPAHPTPRPRIPFRSELADGLGSDEL